MPGDTVRGTLTIGWGHTGPDVHPGQNITQSEADQLLARDLTPFEAGVNSLVSHSITPNQFAALVSFAYNAGLQSLRSSTLRKLLNSGDIQGAANEFGKRVHGNGQVLPGLVTRRAAERTLFLTV